mmetsp:Transcript_60096/g.133922  ORF Transcript_60096/g.133922 Transcript_60096/m.133922 type:complete len:97 (-) Transcript_60096:22-312(-)
MSFIELDEQRASRTIHCRSAERRVYRGGKSQQPARNSHSARTLAQSTVHRDNSEKGGQITHNSSEREVSDSASVLVSPFSILHSNAQHRQHKDSID